MKPPAISSTAVDPQNPWLGLASFTEETRTYFHGRDDDAAELARRVQRKLLTVLFGQSGHGKTLLLRAGLVPRLRDEGYCPVYVRLDYAAESPPPSEQIKMAIFEATLAAGSWTQTGASVSGESLWEFLHHRDDTLRDAAGRPLVPLLIFDQFEEVFTLAQNDDTGRQRAQAFLAELADLVENRPPVELEHRIERDETDAARFDFARADYRILISLREDYLAHLEGLKAQMPSVTQNRVRLARFNGAQALEAVRAPAPELVSEEVATQIVRFVAGGAEVGRAEVEPSLLSLICRELNNARLARGQSEITADLLAGSRETILSEFYENALADQPVGVRRYIEDHLLTDSGFRESVAEERVKKAFAAAGAQPDALAFLVGRRLLRVEERLDVRRVELTHDVLCGVVKASREVRQERESKEALERQLAATRRSLRRARMFATVCALLAVGAIGSAIFGYLSRRRAVTAERLAVEAAADAVNARGLADAGRAQAESLMDYMLSDLREELSELGHAAVLLEVSQKTVAYYNGLPSELMTVATQVAKANALANLAGVLGARDNLASAQTRFEEAVALFESIDRSGTMTPAMRIDYASVLARWARHFSSDIRFEESIRLCDHAEQLLQPALEDPVLRGRALRVLSYALGAKGFSLLRSGRSALSASHTRRAIVAADEADGLPPQPRRPGLQAARQLPWLAEALAASSPAEANEATNEARQRLSRIVEAEPFLTSAKAALANVLTDVYRRHDLEWSFAEAEEARIAKGAIYDELLKLDPKNRVYHNNRAVSYLQANRRSSRERDFIQSENAVKQAIAGLTGIPGNFEKRNLAASYGELAGLYASTGRDKEVDEYLARMQALADELRAVASTDANSPDLSLRGLRGYRRSAEMARLNWAAVRDDAEQFLATAEARPDDDQDDGTLPEGPGRIGRRRTALSQLMTAAWAMGDYPAAKQALNEFERGLPRPPENLPIERRYIHVTSQLERIHVLSRAGDLDEARKRLDTLWPEVEAVFAVRPEAVFTQIQMAHALWVKAEVADGLDAAARRALLDRAIGYMRTWEAAGRLTRFDREVIMAGIEKQRETLPGN